MAEGSKHKILRWRGVLADASATMRALVFAVLAVTCVALTFTQLGFAGIGFSGRYEGYIVVLLLPVALAALLFGILPGGLYGLIAGAVLYAHSKLMPLDYFELTFVDLFTSVILLTLCGLLLGFLFAVALRKDPRQLKRVVYIAIVCVIVSCVYSLLFMFNAVALVVVGMVDAGASEMNAAAVSDLAFSGTASMLLRLGNLSLQLFADALLMTLICVVGDIVARKAIRAQGTVGLRVLFASWLGVVVLMAFMATSAVGFIAISQEELAKAVESMDDELDYLENQMAGYVEREAAFSEFVDSFSSFDEALNEDNFQIYLDAISPKKLLDGYEKESDGIIFLTQDGRVALSDDPRLSVGSPLADFVDDEVLEAIERSIETGEAVRFVYDDADIQGLANEIEESGSASESVAFNDGIARSYLAYVMAREAANQTEVVIIWPASKVYADRAVVMAWTTFSVLVMLLVVFLLTERLLSSVVARRIDETNQALGQITAGDLDVRVDVRDTREFASLSSGINQTVDALKGWISEAETRMDAELATAKVIQESALPRIFPPFPDILRFDVYASMHAAKEVGGDFYDFFLIGDDSGPDAGKLGFVIADVSGKGVPAALFMMNAKALVRSYMESGMELGEAVENANRQLCDGNDEGMFVTLFAGVLDYGTNHIDFVNAGHNPPLLWQEASWRWLKDKSGLPLGLFEGLPYHAYSLDCKVGDQLLMYTDGVTEAMNEAGELYGEARLEQLAVENFPLHPRMLIEEVRRDIVRHAAGAEQSDDITLLVLEVGVPPEITATLAVRADVSELPRVNDFIHTELDRRLCPKRVQNQLDIAVEELFVNVAHYAYPSATPERPGMVRIGYTYSADPPSIVVSIADDGIPYDPLAKPDAVTPDDIMDVPIGGLGILMAKQSVDEMAYERVDGSNVVSITKRW